MRVGLIDVDLESRKKCTFPNLPLMKLSAFHKRAGDTVEWFQPLGGHYDKVYMSKVFSDEYTKDYQYPIDADEIVKGGSGYAMSVEDEKEIYCKAKDPPLPHEVDHIMPDYSLYEPYGITDKAFGFLTRGCPRGCGFCHVAKMQGRASRTVARLSEFWNGQKYIVLLDPNITASQDYFQHVDDLANSKAYVDFSQGLDARLLTDDKIEALNRVKWKHIHFAWDKPEENLKPDFDRLSKRLRRFNRNAVSCYILGNYEGQTVQSVIDRTEYIKSLGIQPYVMLYRKQTAPQVLRDLQRYANNVFVCWKTPTFNDYIPTRSKRKELK